MLVNSTRIGRACRWSMHVVCMLQSHRAGLQAVEEQVRRVGIAGEDGHALRRDDLHDVQACGSVYTLPLASNIAP